MKAPAPEFVKFEVLDYHATLHLALILGLPQELKAPLKALGSVRNKFSHRPAMVIDRATAKDLYTKLGRDADKNLRKGLREMTPLYPERETNVDKMSPKELFCVSCAYLHLVVLHAAVSIAASEVKAK